MYYEVLLIILTIAVIIILSSRLLKKLQMKKTQLEKIRAFKKMYQLNDEELKIFETVMREAKSDILKIVGYTKKSGLSNNANLKKAIHASQSIFKDLMSEPKDLIKYGDLLYKILPGLVLACEEYTDIVEGEVQSDSIQEKRLELLSIIEEFSNRTTKNWEENVNRDVNKVNISKQALEQNGLSI